MAGTDRLLLRCGALELAVAPAKGASITAFDCIKDNRHFPVLRGTEGVPEDVLDAGSFPLVPYVNRIRSGSFTFRGRTVTLTPNLGKDPSPLHGQGWRAAWQVEEAAETSAELVYRHPSGEWPWPYEARQALALDATGLSLLLSCRNLADEPMPCGLGHHPYFHCTAQTQLDTEVTHAWTVDDKVLPVEKVPAEGRYDLRDRPICGQTLDNGFAGWSGLARITDPAVPFTIEMSSPDARFFQVYSPPTGGYFAAEPVTHANAALNEPEERWEELGLRVLAPGEQMTLRTRIDVVFSAAPASPAF